MSWNPFKTSVFKHTHKSVCIQHTEVCDFTTPFRHKIDIRQVAGGQRTNSHFFNWFCLVSSLPFFLDAAALDLLPKQLQFYTPFLLSFLLSTPTPRTTNRKMINQTNEGPPPGPNIASRLRSSNWGHKGERGTNKRGSMSQRNTYNTKTMIWKLTNQ